MAVVCLVSLLALSCGGRGEPSADSSGASDGTNDTLRLRAFRLIARGEVREGIRLLEESQVPGRYDPRVTLHLAVAYYKAGEKERSYEWLARKRKELESLLREHPTRELLCDKAAVDYLLQGDKLFSFKPYRLTQEEEWFTSMFLEPLGCPDSALAALARTVFEPWRDAGGGLENAE